MIRIVDVSEYQGPVAWGRVSAGGVVGGIHKATQYRVDNQHAANHQAIPAAGLPHGCYHFLNFDQPGDSQARFYLQAAGEFGPGTFPPVVDFERSNGKLPSPAQLDAFLKTLPAGRRPLLYGNRGDLATLGTRFIGRVDIWLADYGRNNGQPNGDPEAMRHATQFPAADVKLWQYTSLGQVDGVSGACDMSMWLGTQAELDAYVLKSQSPPHPLPDPVHFKEDNVTKLSASVPPLDDQGNGYITIPGVAGRVVSVNVNGNDPSHQGYDGLKPFFEKSDRGSDVLLVIQGSKPHAGFDIEVWVAN